MGAYQLAKFQFQSRKHSHAKRVTICWLYIRGRRAEIELVIVSVNKLEIN